MALKEKIIERAQKYILKGYFDKALAEYRSAADIDPRDISIRLRIGDLCVKTNRMDDAIKEYMEAARANAQRGFYLKAIAVYKQVLKIDDSILDIHYKLAELYTKQRLIADAIGAYSHIVSIFEKKDKTNEVMELLKKMLDIDPDNVGVRLKLAELYQKLSFDKDALAQYILIFDKLMEKGKFDRAEKVFLSVHNTRPFDPVVLKGLVELYRRKGDETRFLHYAKPLLNIYRENGETGAARALGQMILDMRPYDSDARDFMRSFARPAAAPPPVHEEAKEAPAEEGERLEGPGEEAVKVEAPVFEEAQKPVEGPAAEVSVPEEVVSVVEEIAPEEEEPSEALPEEEEEIDVVLEGFDGGGAALEAPPEEAVEAGEFAGMEEPYGRTVVEESGPVEEQTPVAAEAARIHGVVEPIPAGFAVAPDEEEEVEIDIDLGEDALGISAAPEPRKKAVAAAVPPVEEAAHVEAAAEEITEEPAGAREPQVAEAEPETIETVEEAVVEAGLAVEEAGEAGPEIELPEAELEEGAPVEQAAETIDSAVVEEELSNAIEDLREKIESDEEFLDTDKAVIEEPARESESEYIDLSAELGMEETLEEIAGTWSTGESGSVESLDEFKDGIGTQLSKEDSETHYNLGIAYMEMELYGEAIKEFRVALRDPRLEGDCYARLGLCAMAESRPDEAIGYYLKELKVEGKTESERKGIMYELALAYEAAGETDEALQLFRSIHSSDPGYREVAEKLAAFESERPYIPLDDGLIEVELL